MSSKTDVENIYKICMHEAVTDSLMRVQKIRVCDGHNAIVHVPCRVLIYIGVASLARAEVV